MAETIEQILDELSNVWSLSRYNEIVPVGHVIGQRPDFSDEANQFVVSCDERVNQLRLIAKIMCCADVLNGEKNWRPEYGEPSYYIDGDGDIIIGNTVDIPNLIPFRTMDIAEKTKLMLKI